MVILVQLDALSYSYFGPQYTPFLHRFSRDGAAGRLQTMLAYDGINASIFTGTWPDEHGIWTKFLRDLGHSPLRFSPFRPLGAMARQKYMGDGHRRDGKPNALPVKALRRAFRMLAPGHPMFGAFARIPLVYAHHFDYAILPGTFLAHDFYNGQKTIFGILRAHGLKSGYFYGEIDRVKNYLRGLTHLEEYGLISIHSLVSLDRTAHEYGPFDPVTLAFVRYQDSLLEQFVQMVYDVIGKARDLCFLFFSDHGMVEVTRHVDLSDFLETSLSRREMIVFIDSTMVRVWGQRSDLDYATEHLTQLDCGRILTKSDLERLRIHFQDNRYGDLICSAHPGTVFVPDYFQGTQYVKGMHGYEPGPVNLDGVVILKGADVPTRSLDGVRMVDLFPTMLSILGLPIPNSNEGRSILS